MIFSELYSAYYNTVAKIMEAAFNPEATEKDLQRCVMEEAFSESVLTILPALKSGKWPLLHEDLSPVLLHMSRTKARETLDLEAYRKTMESIYTTSVNEATIDEAPMAYKSLKDIIDVIRESVDVIEILKPIYNFKASE